MRNSGPYAQQFHITPEKGLLNDPNGLCYFQGYYHVFYQYNPYQTNHDTKYWGHVRSKDLIHWEQLPIALKSNDWFDKDGVYSGSAIVHQERLYLFYTGNTKDKNGVRTSYQCLATSHDGIHFEKHGPITEQLSEFTGHIRDPKVWYDQKVNGWWMIVGAQRLNKTGDTVAFFSKDLLHWEYRGSILQFDQPLGYMWECPDLIFLNDHFTGEEKAVFIFSPQGVDPVGDRYQNIFNTTYIVGNWDSLNAKFIPDHPSVQALQECDFGFEYYAPQSFRAPDGRIIQYSWIGMTWPDMEAATPSRHDQWIHHLSMPRALHLYQGKLYQTPVQELDALHQFPQIISAHTHTISDTFRLQLDNLDALTHWEIELDNAFIFDFANQQLRLRRKNWLTEQVESRRLSIDSPIKTLDIWVDRSSVEIYINHGESVFTSKFFGHYQKLMFSENISLKHIQLHTLYPLNFT